MRLFLLSVFAICLINNAHSRALATLPESIAKSTLDMHPTDASSALIEEVVFDPLNIGNFYAHSWDNELYAPVNSGVGWEISPISGSLPPTSGFVSIPYARDIDIDLFYDLSTLSMYIIAGYYYNDGFTKGHYYDIYKYTTAGGFVVSSTMNSLSSSVNFGRINVDATKDGVAIIWHESGVGVRLKGAIHPLSFKHPDICIGKKVVKVD